MKTVMVKYRNLNEQAITFSIGNAPGEAPTVYKVEGGGEVEGPENYVEAFKRAGLVLSSEHPARPAAPGVVKAPEPKAPEPKAPPPEPPSAAKEPEKKPEPPDKGPAPKLEPAVKLVDDDGRGPRKRSG
jgi:hypothetical protein